MVTLLRIFNRAYANNCAHLETDDDEFTEEELADIEKNFYDSL